MAELKQYLIAVVTAAIICGIAKSVGDEKTVSGTVIRLIAGLIMAITVISPLLDFELGKLPALSAEAVGQGKAAAAAGEAMAAAEVNSIITGQLEAYILDKAAAFGADPEVKLRLNDLHPESVVIRGAVSPYAKEQLQWIIENDLGIAKENQRWTG